MEIENELKNYQNRSLRGYAIVANGIIESTWARMILTDEFIHI